jgi:hypothetical protein
MPASSAQAGVATDVTIGITDRLKPAAKRAFRSSFMFKTAESNEGNSWVGNSHDCGFFKGTRRRTPAMAYQMQHRQKKAAHQLRLCRAF